MAPWGPGNGEGMAVAGTMAGAAGGDTATGACTSGCTAVEPLNGGCGFEEVGTNGEEEAESCPALGGGGEDTPRDSNTAEIPNGKCQYKKK